MILRVILFATKSGDDAPRRNQPKYLALPALIAFQTCLRTHLITVPRDCWFLPLDCGKSKDGKSVRHKGDSLSHYVHAHRPDGHLPRGSVFSPAPARTRCACCVPWAARWSSPRGQTCCAQSADHAGGDPESGICGGGNNLLFMSMLLGDRAPCESAFSSNVSPQRYFIDTFD